MLEITVGRAEENNVVVNDKKVSARHLLLSQDAEGKFRVKDLGSTNGTFVNGEKIQNESREITNQTSIRIGDTVLDWVAFFDDKTKNEKPAESEQENEPTATATQIQPKSEDLGKTLSVLKWGFISLVILFLILLLIWYFTSVLAP